MFARWLEHDPATRIQGLTPGELGIYFICGTRDELNLLPMNESFAVLLDDLGHPYVFETDDGFHFSPAHVGPELHAAPNPFNPSLDVSFTLARPQPARLTVHDLSGRLVRVLHDGWFAAGEQEHRWDGRKIAGREAPSGTYLVRLAGEEVMAARKVQLVR